MKLIHNGILSLVSMKPSFVSELSKQRKNRRPIFIVGTGRCGTTLLASMIGSHSNIVITPETAILFEIDQMVQFSNDVDTLIGIFTKNTRWSDFQLSPERFVQRLKKYRFLTVPIVMDEFYDCFVENTKKPRWGDNTPAYSELLPKIIRIWPNAYVIHIYRDGRGVAASLQKVPWGPKNIEESAYLWRNRIIKCRKDSRLCKHYFEVKYELLIQDPQKILREVCEFINEPFEEEMLKYHERDGRERYNLMIKNSAWDGRKEYHRNLNRPPDIKLTEKWRNDLNRQQIAKFQIIAGDLLTELGYPNL